MDQNNIFRPNEPNFFKPFLPSCFTHLKIPSAFFSKYLGSQNIPEHALLRRSSREWTVKVDGLKFEDGWEKFVRDNNLQFGEFLVFRHEGDMVFDVIVFDSSACEKYYSSQPNGNQVDDPKEVRRNENDKESKPMNLPNGSKEKVIKEKASLEKAERIPAISQAGHPCFFSTVKPHSLKCSRLYIPIEFARLNNLAKRDCKMILIDDERRSWTVSLRDEGRQVLIGKGWLDFCSGNGLKAGDSYLFELVSNGHKPRANFVTRGLNLH